MAELPYHLQTLPSESLDILRYYAALTDESAHADDITDGARLSERGFGKGIRRLVTRNYLSMSAEKVYRLTDLGRRSISELIGFDAEGGAQQDTTREPQFVSRRLVIATPTTLIAQTPMLVVVGFDDAEASDRLTESTEVILRFRVLHGEPNRPREEVVRIHNDHVSRTFEVTAADFTRARLRIEALQYRTDLDDYEFVGGLYVDLPVQADETNTPTNPAAYGIDLLLRDESFV